MFIACGKRESGPGLWPRTALRVYRYAWFLGGDSVGGVALGGCGVVGGYLLHGFAYGAYDGVACAVYGLYHLADYFFFGGLLLVVLVAAAGGEHGHGADGACEKYFLDHFLCQLD